MHRKVSSLFLPVTLALVFSTPFLGCQQTGGNNNGAGGSSTGGTTAKGGSGGNNSGGSGGGSGGSNTGGTTAKGGSGGTSAGGSGGTSAGGSGGTNTGGTTVKGGSGGNSGGSGGTSAGGSGGTNAGGTNAGGSGGTSAGGSGGTNAGGSGGTSAGGSGGTSAGGAGGTSAGGAGGTSAGGTGAGGAGGGAGGSTASGDMISDFEDDPGKASMIKSGGRTGYWYVYFPASDTTATPASGMTISPALNNGSPVVTEKDGSTNALHFKGTGYGTSPNNYAGTGAAFKPHAYPDKVSDAYDVSSYSGISFKIKSGSGTPTPLFFEVLTKESQPSTSGGTATSDAIDKYNTRGYLLHTPWLPTAIGTSWQTVTIPFGLLVPRHLNDAKNCGTTTTPKCQPPAFVPANVLGIQISAYGGEKGWPTVSGATVGSFDIWVDDVQFTKGDTGLQTLPGFPLASPGTMGSCKLPQGPSASAKYLVPAYNMWKQTFVSGGKVIRPENGNDTVSEGIAYGMLIAVSMNDKATFDSLYSYWKGHDAGGNLMTWCIPAGSGSCSASGGSATDADEDAAYALLQADKVFGGGSYKSDAMAMIGQIWAKDIDKTSKLPTGGSNYATTSSSPTNPSYFSPAMYAAFKAAGDSNDWDGVIAAVYKSINTSLAGTNSNGLYAAWCSNNCSAIGTNGADSDKYYQYDSHRIPMRIGMDYCYNNRADAKTYVAKTTKFFSTNANAGAGGISKIFDVYDPASSNVAGSTPTPQNNSASIIGTMAVGAMADGSNQAFINDAYQAVFDFITRTSLSNTDPAGKAAYAYYNATVGMLTALIMTGAFSHQ